MDGPVQGHDAFGGHKQVEDVFLDAVSSKNDHEDIVTKTPSVADTYATQHHASRIVEVKVMGEPWQSSWLPHDPLNERGMHTPGCTP